MCCPGEEFGSTPCRGETQAEGEEASTRGARTDAMRGSAISPQLQEGAARSRGELLSRRTSTRSPPSTDLK